MFIACIAMLFSACHKDGVFNPSKKISKIYSINSTGQKYLKEVWSWNKDNTLDKIDFYDGNIYKTYNFTYDKKRLTRINDYSNKRATEYKYDNQGLKEASYYSNGVLVETYTFTHKNGKITQITETYYNNYKGGDERFDMNPLQFVMPEEMSSAAFETSKKIKKDCKSISTYNYDLTWEKNNVTKMTYSNYLSGDTYTYEAQYDNKKNPYYGAYLSFYFESDIINQSKNNVTHIEYTVIDDGETYREIENFEYKYDGQWPTTKRYFDGEYTYSLEYEYTK